MKKIGFKHISLVLALIAMLEGAAIAVAARPVTLIDTSNTGLDQGAVMLIGLQLLLLGLLALLAIAVSNGLFNLDKMFSKVLDLHDKMPLIFSWLPAVVGAVIAVEGIAAAFMAAPMNVEGIGGMRSFVLAAFAAQLFFVGAGLLTLHLFQGRENLQLMIRKGLFLVVASSGLFIIGIAGRTTIEGIGGIRAVTVELAGAQLLAFALLGIFIMFMNGRSIFGKKLFGHRLGSLGEVGVATLIGLEGLVIASLAAQLNIEGMGVIDAGTILVAGLLLAVVALLIPATYYLMEKKDVDTKKLATAACLFLVFLLPFSLLM